MIRHRARWTFLAAFALPLAAVACGDDDAPAGPAPAAGGQAGTSAGGPGKGGSPGTSGEGGSAAGAAGKSGASGKAGSAGKTDRPTDIKPETCEESHGGTGCCGPDGNAYYFSAGKIVIEDCASDGGVCGWSEGAMGGGFYTCVDAESEDPSGAFPKTCGGPVPAKSGCPTVCASDADCAANASEGLTKCDTKAKTCVACLAEADCKDGESCSSTHVCAKKECTSDAQCKTAGAPACDVTAFECVECNTDVNCATSTYGSKCDTETHLCGCDTDAQCGPTTTGGKCIANECSCAVDVDCKDPKNPVCVSVESLFGTSQTCAECKTDASCTGAGDKKFCDTDGFVCSLCNDDFDCADVTKSKCLVDAKTGVKSCGSADACTGDDTHEPNDDGAAGATELADGTDITAKICDAADESDFYKLNASDGDEVTITVTADDAKQQIYFYVTDADGVPFGVALHGATDSVKLTYLPTGTYYVQVKVLGGDKEDPVAKGYKIGLTRVSGGKCKTVADCAAEFSHQIFRGQCDAAKGACIAVDGKKTKKAGEVCDADGDCASEKCAGGLFAKNQDKLSVCSTDCTDAMTGEPDDAKCTGAVCGLYGVCTAKCTADEECPISSLSTAPTGGKPWAYLACKEGACQAPKSPLARLA